MLRARGRTHRRVQLLLSLVLALSLLPMGTALADPGFATDNFKAKWQRADKPVNDGSASPQRSWLWGPESFNPPTGQTEPYAESPGGNRTVQYFDKARMELNNPTTGAVTNGLLVKELISGKLATGDTTSTTRRAADDIPVAGDPAGNDGPTYASFNKLASLNNDNPSANKTGSAVDTTIDKAGNVGSNADLGSKAKYVYFDDSLKHNVPDVFMNFMNQKGNVYVNGQLVKDQPVLGDNPLAPWLDAMGLPISDAYWSKVTVGGQVKDVLIQAFERRVLTYTPSNDPAYQVEMGNVGRHYFNWRYDKKYDQTTQPPTTQPPASGPKSCAELTELGTNGAFPLTKCGPAGIEMVVVAPMQPNENITLTVVSPTGKIVGPFDDKAEGDGTYITGLSTSPASAQGKWTFKMKGASSGKEAEAYVWLDPPVSAPTIVVYPNPGKLSERIAFAIVGFQPKEPVRLNIRSPQGPSANFTDPVVTSSGGGYTLIMVPNRDIQPSKYAIPGDWFMSAVAVNDGKRFATVTFKLTN